MSDPRGAAGQSPSRAAPSATHPTTPTGDPAAQAAAPEDSPEALETTEPGVTGGVGPTPAPPDDGTDTGTTADDLTAEDLPLDDLPTEGLPTADAGPTELVLDASIHAHVFDDPLPPVADDADTPLFEEIRPRTETDPGPASAALVAEPTQSRGPDDTGPWLETGVTDDVPPVRTAGGEAPIRHAHVGQPAEPLVGRRGFRTGVGALVVIALLVTSGLAAYLYQSARAWRDRADGYESTAHSLGEDLATGRTDLAGAQAELAAVRDQLATAHQRITELASEKAQLSDEWEITQQLVDYQERVSDAAGQVALSLDQCVQGQQELIGYLARAAEQADSTATPPPYDPAQLAQFETDVEALCQAASEANIALQRELAR